MVKKDLKIRIGTAGWSIPNQTLEYFPRDGSHLERYSKVFNAVEINTTFSKRHQKSTFKRWASSTPYDFQFSVKMPKEITHNKLLAHIEDDLDNFIEEISYLQTKLGPLLIQVPPSLPFNSKIADNFFTQLRKRFKGHVVLEPRHLTWSEQEAITMLKFYNVEPVIADPVKVPIVMNGIHPKYYRLHGSPKMYSSSYNPEFLNQLSKQIDHSSWIIFDNTRLGAATQNALDLKTVISHKSS